MVRGLLGKTWIDRFGQKHEVTLDDVLIVTPYNAQVAKLTAALPEGARIGTVDKFQGQEAPVVIYSMATSSADDVPRSMEFLYDLHRLNVAVSRAVRGVDGRRQPRIAEGPVPNACAVETGERTLSLCGRGGDCAVTNQSRSRRNRAAADARFDSAGKKKTKKNKTKSESKSDRQNARPVLRVKNMERDTDGHLRTKAKSVGKVCIRCGQTLGPSAYAAKRDRICRDCRRPSLGHVVSGGLPGLGRRR